VIHVKREAMMLKFAEIVPVLKVLDMQKSVDFYTGVLGFAVVWRATNDGGDGENCMLQRGTTNIMLSTGSHLGEKPQFAGTLYFLINGVEAFFDRIKNKVEVVWPLELMDYGQTEFGIRDCDGYTLAFAEAIEKVRTREISCWTANSRSTSSSYNTAECSWGTSMTSG
jgi:catechol 2,3-dioxygenase-like lactoylglutathione lyase family enzyme